MNISPSDVIYFLAVAKHGGIAKGAEACHIAQPTLTKAIQRLEAACGLALFERDGRGVRLTATGERFAKVAESMNRNYEEVMRQASDIRAQQAGFLRLGCTDSTRASLVPATLSTLLHQRPGLRTTLQIGQSDRIARSVAEGHLDIAVIPAYGVPPKGCDHIQVGEDPLLPAMSARHPLAKRSHLTAVDLTPYKWIAAARDKADFLSLSALFARHRLPSPTVAVEIEHASEAALSLVQNTDMLAMIPRSLYHATEQFDLRTIPIEGFQIDRQVLCITRAGSDRSPLISAFYDLLMIQSDAWQKRHANRRTSGAMS